MVNLTSDGNISISDDHIGLDVDYYDTVDTNENRTNMTNITLDYQHNLRCKLITKLVIDLNNKCI